MMHCSNCGNPLKGHEKYCAKCGKPVGNETIEKSSEVSVSNTNKNHGGKNLFLIIVGILLLVAVIVILIIFMKKDEVSSEAEISNIENEVEETKTETQTESEIQTENLSTEELAEKYYDSLLIRFQKYEANKFEETDLQKEFVEMNYLYHWGASVNLELYYALIDLANDGVPELFIADEDKRIYDVFVKDAELDKEYVLVPGLGERTWCSVCENNVIKVYGSGGADTGGTDYWKLEETETKLELIEHICHDGTTSNGEVLMSYYYGTIRVEGEYGYEYEDERPISQEDYQKIENSYREKTDIEWHKLSEYKSVNFNNNSNTNADYILPNSNTKYLTNVDLQGFTKEDCRIARNEIYARYGRIFTDEALKEYFESKSWYHGTISAEDFTEDMLNEYEVANRDLIIQYEEMNGYR